MSDKAESIETIQMTFTWIEFSPDHRAYKPSNPKIIADCQVAIDVPLTPDLIYNAQEILAQRSKSREHETINMLAAHKVEQLPDVAFSAPILTPLGMRYIIDQFEIVMSDLSPEDQERVKQIAKPAQVVEGDEDWDDGSKAQAEPVKETVKANGNKRAEDWEDLDEINPKSEKTDENWDENWES